jgi:hypothetical protein
LKIVFSEYFFPDFSLEKLRLSVLLSAVHLLSLLQSLICFDHKVTEAETLKEVIARSYKKRDMEWLGHARTTFTHSPNPLALVKKDGTSTDLLSICEESTPPCHLNPLLFNGHLQTMWTAVKNSGPPIYYKRKIFENEDPDYKGSFAVDFVVPPFSENDENLPPRTTNFTVEEFEGIGSLDSRPMLVALHGLSGGSYEIYLRHVLAPLIAAEGDRRWEACVVNSRGCAMHKITTSILYNARATWDCRQTVRWLREKFPNRPLFGIGFSLGANIMTNVCLKMAILNIFIKLTAVSTLEKKVLHAYLRSAKSLVLSSLKFFPVILGLCPML